MQVLSTRDDGQGAVTGLQLLCARHLPGDALAFWKWVSPLALSSCALALRGGQRAIIADYEQWAEIAGTEELEAFRRTGIRAAQTTPLVSRSGALLGMISTHWRQPHHPSGRDLRLWPAFIDASQLENALLNLCINARDAMPEGGLIQVSTSNLHLDGDQAVALELPAGGYLCLTVSDTGGGMPAHMLERAFEPFFTTKPDGQGTGLGLSMIYGFVQQSGGQAHIASQQGAGTTVSLYLPRHEGQR